MFKFMRFRGSHLAQRIITFNTVALCVLMIGILYLSQFQNNSLRDRQSGMILESDLFVRLAEATIAGKTDPDVVRVSSQLELDALSYGSHTGQRDAEGSFA